MSDSADDLKRIEVYGRAGCIHADCVNNPFYPEAESYCEMCAEEREGK